MVIIKRTNHGTDGWDARTTDWGYAESEEQAKKELAKLGYTYFQYGGYFHSDESQRHCMGAISFSIKKLQKAEAPSPSEKLKKEIQELETKLAAKKKLLDTLG